MVSEEPSISFMDMEKESAQYVPFFETQKAMLAWIYETFNCPLFQWWNYCWHLIPKTPVQLCIQSFVMGIGPESVEKVILHTILLNKLKSK